MSVVIACVEVGDWLLRDLVQEITEACQREVAGEVTCTKEVLKLLEGTMGTLAPCTLVVTSACMTRPTRGRLAWR